MTVCRQRMRPAGQPRVPAAERSATHRSTRRTSRRRTACRRRRLRRRRRERGRAPRDLSRVAPFYAVKNGGPHPADFNGLLVLVAAVLVAAAAMVAVGGGCRWRMVLVVVAGVAGWGEI